ncbi:unnamed protein product [Parajaminaea phylloscopi]
MGSSIASAVIPAISIGLPSSESKRAAPAASTADSSTSASASASDNHQAAGTSSEPSEEASKSEAEKNPQLQYQNHHHHHSHMPFTIGPLRQNQQKAEGGEERKEPRRPSKRDRLAKAGRSLSPFRRYHGRSPSLTRLSEALSAVRFYHHGDKLLTPPKANSSADSADTESETESIKKGLCPRNTAFNPRGKPSDDDDDDGDDDDDDDDAHSDVGRVSHGRGEEDDYDSDDDTIAQQDRTSRPRSKDGTESPLSHSDDSGDERDASSDRETGGGGEEGEEEDDSLIDFDDATIDNTLFNAGCLDLHNAWQNNKESIGEGGWYPSDDDPSWHQDSAAAGGGGGTVVAEPDSLDGAAEGVGVSLDGTPGPSSPTNDLHDRLPNVILPSSHRPQVPQRQGSKWVSAPEGDEPSLVASRPIFARNRCTITLVHGEYEKAVAKRQEGGGRGPKKWIVCSDGSEESSYAIEWTIGTVLRDGDETLVISVMETSEKLDPPRPATAAVAQAFQKENHRIRQSMALVLARQATALLQRTKLAVKITCQALHAKHSRHMLLDLIDFFEPTMVIVGSRGLGSLKGILLGSTSHYLLQKSSRPIMIARKRLQLPALPRGKGDVVSSVRRRHMRLDEAAIEKKSKVGEEEDEGREKDDDSQTEGEGEGEREREGQAGAEEGDASSTKSGHPADDETGQGDAGGERDAPKTSTEDTASGESSSAPAPGRDTSPTTPTVRPSEQKSRREDDDADDDDAGDGDDEGDAPRGRTRRSSSSSSAAATKSPLSRPAASSDGAALNQEDTAGPASEQQQQEEQEPEQERGRSRSRVRSQS